MAKYSFEEEGLKNLFFITLFFLILFSILYFSYTQVHKLFYKREAFTPEPKPVTKNIHYQEETQKNDIEEPFLNLFSLQDVFMDLENEEHNKNENDNETEIIREKINHPRNEKVKIREEEEKEEKEEKEVKPSIQKIQPKENYSIQYIVDKNRYHYTILNENRNLQYIINGYKDPYFIHQIMDKNKKDISVIKNKIYNQYYFIYKTEKDENVKLYYIEFRPSQPRFIKIYDEDDKIAFYFEKIEYKHDVENINSIPLYQIFYYGEKMGKIYLHQSDNNDDTTYFIHIQEEKKSYKELLSFGFILYLSLSKDNEENYD